MPKEAMSVTLDKEIIDRINDYSHEIGENNRSRVVGRLIDIAFQHLDEKKDRKAEEQAQLEKALLDKYHYYTQNRQVYLLYSLYEMMAMLNPQLDKREVHKRVLDRLDTLETEFRTKNNG